MIGCGGRLRGVVGQIPGVGKDILVKAICDPAEKSIAATKKQFGEDIKVHSDYRALARDPEVDWVFVGSWNCFHREHAIAAFEAGKDVFCEKPLATTVEDCLAMKRAHAKSGKNFIMGFTLRYSPHYRKIKEMVAEGAVGEIVSLEFNETLGFNHGGYIHADWRRLTQNAGTHLLEKCCHDVDLVNWIVGAKASRVASFGGLDFFKPENQGHIARLGKDKDGHDAYQTWDIMERLNPFTTEKDIVDNQVAIIEFKNHVRASFHTNCNCAIPERRMCVVGTEGAIRADVVAGFIQHQRVGFDTTIENVDMGVSGGHGGGDSILGKALADSILNGTPSITPLEDGFAAALTCFAIDEAMSSGKVVDVNNYWNKGV